MTTKFPAACSTCCMITPSLNVDGQSLCSIEDLLAVHTFVFRFLCCFHLVSSVQTDSPKQHCSIYMFELSAGGLKLGSKYFKSTNERLVFKQQKYHWTNQDTTHRQQKIYLDFKGIDGQDMEARLSICLDQSEYGTEIKDNRYNDGTPHWTPHFRKFIGGHPRVGCHFWGVLVFGFELILGEGCVGWECRGGQELIS